MTTWNDSEILRYLGHRGQEIPDQITELIQQCKGELEQVAVPKSIWRSFPLAVTGKFIDMGFLQTESQNLARNLADCDEILVLGATLGIGVDVLLQKYGKLQMSKAVVMQAASVAMLETYCDEINGQIKQQYLDQGHYTRPRFSPGYGDFPLECQVAIAGVLEMGKRIGINLTDSLLMTPSKSVTAVIGISPISRDCTIKGCECCAKTDCAYRR